MTVFRHKCIINDTGSTTNWTVGSCSHYYMRNTDKLILSYLARTAILLCIYIVYKRNHNSQVAGYRIDAYLPYSMYISCWRRPHKGIKRLVDSRTPRAI